MHRKLTAAGLAAATLVLSAGGAYAYWTAAGSGSSTATVAEVKPLDIKAANVAGLVVGKSAPLVTTLTNPNDFEVSLTGTHITVTLTTDQKHAACGPENFAIKVPSTRAAKIGAGDSISLDSGSVTLLNTTTDQSSCQGATVTLDYILK